jgi:hypothetical protein
MARALAAAGQRVRHKTLGLGTVLERDGNTVHCDMDADEGKRMRTFLSNLGTLAPHTDEHPPTDQIPAQPKALEPKPEPHQPETPMPEDTLLAAMNAALADRGKGAIAGLTATLGISKNTPNNWRHIGRIPDCQRDAVQNWIDKGQILAIRVEKAKPAPKPTKAPKLRIVSAKKITTRPVSIVAAEPIRSAIDHDTVLQALGLTITTAWLPEGETMRQVRVAVLP